METSAEVVKEACGTRNIGEKFYLAIKVKKKKLPEK